MALPASLPRLSIRWRSPPIILLLHMPFLSMKNTTRTMFHSFLATIGGLGSISITIGSLRDWVFWFDSAETERDRSTASFVLGWSWRVRGGESKVYKG